MAWHTCPFANSAILFISFFKKKRRKMNKNGSSKSTHFDIIMTYKFIAHAITVDCRMSSFENVLICSIF